MTNVGNLQTTKGVELPKGQQKGSNGFTVANGGDTYYGSKDTNMTGGGTFKGADYQEASQDNKYKINMGNALSKGNKLLKEGKSTKSEGKKENSTQSSFCDQMSTNMQSNIKTMLEANDNIKAQGDIGRKADKQIKKDNSGIKTANKTYETAGKTREELEAEKEVLVAEALELINHSEFGEFETIEEFLEFAGELLGEDGAQEKIEELKQKNDELNTKKADFAQMPEGPEKDALGKDIAKLEAYIENNSMASDGKTDLLKLSEIYEKVMGIQEQIVPLNEAISEQTDIQTLAQDTKENLIDDVVGNVASVKKANKQISISAAYASAAAADNGETGKRTNASIHHWRNVQKDCQYTSVGLGVASAGCYLVAGAMSLVPGGWSASAPVRSLGTGLAGVAGAVATVGQAGGMIADHKEKKLNKDIADTSDTSGNVERSAQEQEQDINRAINSGSVYT